MMKKLFIASVLVAVALGCSKKKQGEGAEAGLTDGDTTVTNSPLAFNAQGSDSGQIAGLSTIYFDYDQSTINAESRKILAENATWMKKNANTVMQVEGHCDERGSIEYNLALGERRAKAVKSYLVSLGVDAKKITVISFGKEKKLSDGDTEAAHGKNRRANFVPLAN